MEKTKGWAVRVGLVKRTDGLDRAFINVNVLVILDILQRAGAVNVERDNETETIFSLALHGRHDKLWADMLVDFIKSHDINASAIPKYIK